MGTKKTAKKVRDTESGKAVYELSEPVEYGYEDEPRNMTRFVWVSTALDETYIFPCDEAGKVLAWGELDGSFKGSGTHADALNGLGFEVSP